MTETWLFFTEVRAATPGHCERVWRWRHISGSDVTESGPFTVLPDCVADARKDGYGGETLDIGARDD
jgi:hypothetical protein